MRCLTSYKQPLPYSIMLIKREDNSLQNWTRIFIKTFLVLKALKLVKTENLYLNKSCVFGTLYIHIFMYPKFCLLKKKLWSCKLGGPTIQISNRIIGHNNFNCRNSNLASTSFHNLAREQARPKRTALVEKKTATLLPFFLLVDSQG